MSASLEDRLDVARIRTRLERLGHQPRQRWRGRVDFEPDELSASAVLIPVCERDDGFHVLFTERAHDLRNHSGEISFPGGRRDPVDDSLEECALREAYEEVALLPADVHLFGALTHIPTITGFEVTSFVGEYDYPYDFIVNDREIATLFDAPLRHLADPANHRLEQREYDGQTFPIHFFDYKGHVIWGATGFLLYSLLEYLDLADPTAAAP